MNLLRSRILWKIYTAFVIVVVVAAVMVSMVVSGVIRDKTLAEVQQTLNVRTLFLSQLGRPLLQGEKVSDFSRVIKEVAARSHTRFTLINARGTVLVDSDKDPSLMDNHARRPEIMASKFHVFGVATRYSDTLKTEMMYLARSVRNAGELLGYVRAAQPLTLINQRISESRQMIFMGIGMIALIALFLGFILARHFIRPLLAMTQMAEAMAGGDFSSTLDYHRRDEIGRLAQAFNLMAEKSRQRITTINNDRAKLNAILTSMREGVVAVDCDEKIVHMNQAAVNILNIDDKEWAGKAIWEITRLSELCGALTEVLQSRVEIKRSVNISYGMQERVVEMYAVPLKSSTTMLVGAMVVLLDISELRRLETVRRDFVSNASHELKTPITAIRALVETMIDDAARMPEAVRASFLNKIARQSVRLSALVVDLMALSRFETQSQEQLLKVRLELNEVVAASVNCLMPLAEEQGLKLEYAVPGEKIELLGNAEMLDQAITNILDNAIKYNAPGGRVKIELERVGAEGVVTVQDTGIGIPPPEKERIFERFYRVDKARSRELGGTGLGLAIVRHIVSAHGGRIEVESRIGQGSTFRLFFPVAESPGTTITETKEENHG